MPSQALSKHLQSRAARSYAAASSSKPPSLSPAEGRDAAKAFLDDVRVSFNNMKEWKGTAGELCNRCNDLANQMILCLLSIPPEERPDWVLDLSSVLLNVYIYSQKQGVRALMAARMFCPNIINDSASSNAAKARAKKLMEDWK